MKIKLLLSFCITSTFIQAQPVLTRINYFSIGDSVQIYNKYDSALVGASIGPAGANVLWDFSSLDFNHPSVHKDSIFYIDPVGTPWYPTWMSADYSQSNLCYVVKVDPTISNQADYNYCYSDNDSICFIGHWATGGAVEIWEDHCIDFIKELSFPLTYQSSYVDSFQRFYFDMSGSDEHYISGTLSVTADGYGNMITPDGTTVMNVLRLHTIETTRDSNLTFGITNTIRHKFLWYSSDLKGFILRFDMNSTDSTIIGSALYQKQTNIISTIDRNELQTLIVIYPNPGTGHFKVIHPFKNRNCTIEIYNTLGSQITMKSISGNSYDLDLTNQPAGIYFVKINSEMIGYQKN